MSSPQDSKLSHPLLSSPFSYSFATHNHVHNLDDITTPFDTYSQGDMTTQSESEILFTGPPPAYSPARILDASHPVLLSGFGANNIYATNVYPRDQYLRLGFIKQIDHVPAVYPPSQILANPISPRAFANSSKGYLDPIVNKHQLLEQQLDSFEDEQLRPEFKMLMDIVRETQRIPDTAHDAIVNKFGQDRYRELAQLPLFLFLNVVHCGLWMDDVMPSFPRLPLQEERTQRTTNSIETIYGAVLRTLVEPATREQLSARTGFPRRRLSSAMMPLRAVGLVAEPENLKRGHPNSDRAVQEHDGGPNLILCRNVRQEAASFAISGFCRYYRQLQRIRTHLEKTVGLIKYNNSFVDERLTTLTQPHPDASKRSLGPE